MLENKDKKTLKALNPNLNVWVWQYHGMGLHCCR